MLCARRKRKTARLLGGAVLATLPAAAVADGLDGSLLETVRPAAAQPGVAVPELPRSVSVTMSRPVAVRPASHSRQPTGLVADVAHRWRIDPSLLAAVVKAESGGRQQAVSPKGALGLMQVMPATARSLGVEPRALLTDPGLALETGAAYLKTLQAQLGNDVPLVVAAYNAGPRAVLRAGMRVPAYPETQAYVGKVMAGYAVARAVGSR